MFAWCKRLGRLRTPSNDMKWWASWWRPYIPFWCWGSPDNMVDLLMSIIRVSKLKSIILNKFIHNRIRDKMTDQTGIWTWALWISSQLGVLYKLTYMEPESHYLSSSLKWPFLSNINIPDSFPWYELTCKSQQDSLRLKIIDGIIKSSEERNYYLL